MPIHEDGHYLQRIGDLFASVASCARALLNRIAIEDFTDVVRMATMLETMLADAHGAFTVRNVDRAMAVLRADAELDRLRNLLVPRHLEHAQSDGTQESIHVLFMAQALERAGDHVKNLAEEMRPACAKVSTALGFEFNHPPQSPSEKTP